MNNYNEEYLKNNLEVLNKNYLKSLQSYWLYTENNKFKNTALLGEKDAQSNIDLMNKYKSIFGFLDFGTLDLTIIELNKIFNEGDEINIYKIINYIFNHRKSINKLRKKKLLNKCKELKQTIYNDFSLEKIIEIEGSMNEIGDDFKIILDTKLAVIEDRIKDLLCSRHNRSHNLKKLKITNLKFIDLDEIFILFEELFNLIQKNVFDVIYDYGDFKKHISTDFYLLFQNLSDFDKIRNLFFDNFLKNLGKTDEEIYIEIKDILKIDFM